MKGLLFGVLAFVLVASGGCDKLKSPTGPGNLPPVISSFTVNPTSGKAGIAVQLSWDVAENDARVSITASAGANPGDVPTTGVLTVTPLVTTTYTLIARNQLGAQSTRTATFTVTP